MFSKVQKTAEGFYIYTDRPEQDEVKELYENKYFQNQIENKKRENVQVNYYQNEYSEEERKYMFNEYEKIYSVLTKHKGEVKGLNILDLGCGEGFGLSYFNEKGLNVKGIDLTNYACQHHNSKMVKNIVVGDLYKELDIMMQKKEKFEFIICMNVLEHVLYPKELIEKAKEVLAPKGILMIKVPNDFSVLQKYLWDKKYIDNPFWIAIPDHINYFSLESLKEVGKGLNINTLDYYVDYPVDINLINQHTNYIKNKELGKSCHIAKIELDSLMCNISLEKTIELYKKYAELGLGRNISIFYQVE